MRAICLGDPVIDVLGVIERKSLQALNVTEGGCLSLGQSEFTALIDHLPLHTTLKRYARAAYPAAQTILANILEFQKNSALPFASRTCGGSAANVAKGLANLLGHQGTAAFAGRVGSDSGGRCALSNPCRHQAQLHQCLPAKPAAFEV